MIDHANDTAIINHPSFDAIRRIIIDTTGLAYLATRPHPLAVQLRRRMDALNLADLADYRRRLAHADTHETELEWLAATLTIGETYFFRHPELFDALRNKILPQLLAKNRDKRRLRIWSAGCSIGAEPASMAIMLLHDLGHLTLDWQIDIIATDINKAFLRQACDGRYNQWALRGISDELVRHCFDRDGDQWILKSRYRGIIDYQYHNLIQHHVPSMHNNLFAFDLILCRNVFIYFDKYVIKQLADNFHRCLVDDGYLCVGHCELSQSAFGQYATVQIGGACVYQRQTDVRSDDVAPPTLTFDFDRHLPPAPRPTVTTTPVPHVAARQHTAVDTSMDWHDEFQRLADHGQLEQAEAACRRRIEESRFDVTAYLHLGLILDQMGRRHEAETALRGAIYIDRELPLAYYLLGLIQRRDHRVEAAARSFTNAGDLLANIADDQIVVRGENMTAAELRQLVAAQKELLKAA